MISMTTLQTAIYNLFNKYKSAGVTIIWANQAEARPEKPYVSLQIIMGPKKIGYDDELVGADNKVARRGVRELTVSVNYFGAEALTKMASFQESIELPTAREMLRVTNLVLVRSTSPRDLSALMENRFETRAQMDVDFRLSSEVKDLDSTYIESVILSNDLDNSINEIP
ncbi:phage neck terminator protein [Immundisolibacter sp.]